jgi:endonuclease YncB( thermonuclease family)
MRDMTHRLAPAARLARLALLALTTVAAVAPAGAAAARGRRPHGLPATLRLDGQPTQVRWIDGDTFQVDSGPLEGFATRLVGYNALESFGPVHRIGTATPEALWLVARAAAPLLAREEWRCTTLGRRDGYGRALVSCPEAAATLVRAGLALAFAMEGPADPALLAAQRQAQAARAGLWAGGVPPLVVTSVHSDGEQGLGTRGAYDRVVDTRTGRASPRPHRRRYATCEEACVGEGASRSCMVYVPFERRFRDRPACLGPWPPAEAPPRAGP